MLPKVKAASDAFLQDTLSGSFMSGVIPKGALLTNVRIIAGAGTSSELREAARLSQAYGGVPEQWEKKGGLAETNHDSYDVHWYELNGVQYEPKIKPTSKPKP